MDGQAPCYPAFALVVRLRKCHRDEENLPIQVQPSLLGAPYQGNFRVELGYCSEAANAADFPATLTGQ